MVEPEMVEPEMVEPEMVEPEPAYPSDHEQLIAFLERDQLSADRRRRVPRAPLSPRAKLGLWALRVFVLVVSAMVIYTFFAQLG